MYENAVIGGVLSFRMIRAQDSLGVMYEGRSDGSAGVARDYSWAVKWFRRAAQQGVADAQLSLGLMYVQGQGVPNDSGQAIRWYYAQAVKWIALCKYESKPGSQTYVEASKILRHFNTIMPPPLIAKGQKEALAWLAAHPTGGN